MAVWRSSAVGLIGIGFYLATSIAGLTVVGNLLDRRFGSEPALTLAFLVLGLLVGFTGAWRQLQRVLRHADER